MQTESAVSCGPGRDRLQVSLSYRLEAANDGYVHSCRSQIAFLTVTARARSRSSNSRSGHEARH